MVARPLSFEAEQLVQAVNISLSATVNCQERTHAYNLCEKFKEESPLCATIGFELACCCSNLNARHFGLKLVEHCVKFRWTYIDTNEKVLIKVSSTSFLKLNYEIDLQLLILYSFDLELGLGDHSEWHSSVL